VSSLADHLERLSAWLRRDGTAPRWRGVRLIEAKDVVWGAVSMIPESATRSMSEYEARFDALLAVGYAWLNLSALGVLAGQLLVCVELPRDPVGAYGRTSVNLSGPPLDMAGGPVWDASVRYRIV
jgi:hypothetical protein